MGLFRLWRQRCAIRVERREIFANPLVFSASVNISIEEVTPVKHKCGSIGLEKRESSVDEPICAFMKRAASIPGRVARTLRRGHLSTPIRGIFHT